MGSMYSFKKFLNENNKKTIIIYGYFKTDIDIDIFKKEALKNGVDVTFYATEPVNYFEINQEHIGLIKTILKKFKYKIFKIK